MTALVLDRLAELRQLCAKYRVRRLALFGSATREDFDPARSDVDLMVEFQPMTPVEHADSYFGLVEELETLLDVPVDLVEAAPMRNPYFRRAVERNHTVLYDRS